MTNREKLVALLMEAMEEGEKECLSTANCPDCRAYEKYSRDECGLALSALHLISNGVVVREKGEWERRIDDEPNGEVWYWYHCPVCDADEGFPSNFCPNCGADMRKGENG